MKLPIRLLLILAVCVGAATAVHASNTILAKPYPTPAKTPKTEVLCATCKDMTTSPSRDVHPPTVGYQGDISTFVGRFLDSDYVQDIQGPIRTLRASLIKYDAAHDRIYMNHGGEMVAYDGASFISRLNSGEALRVMGNRSPLPAELWLGWTRNFYPEDDREWVPTYLPDGQNYFQDFDYDDRGNLYIAYSAFWGIAKDDYGTATGGVMTPVSPAMADAVVSPVQTVNSIKTSDGKYYAIIATTGGTTSYVYDVSNVASPVRTGVVLNRVIIQNSLVKSSDQRTIALVNNNNHSVEFFTPEGLIAGGSPIITFRPVLEYKGITTDGTNFYSVERTFSSQSISTFTPSGGTFTEHKASIGGGYNPYNIKYGNGYVSIPGSYGTAEDIRVFRMSGFTPSELDLSAYLANSSSAPRYFQTYYGASAAPSGYLAPEQINFTDSYVYKTGGKTYLIANMRGLGDVYELKASNSVSATKKGLNGTTNPYSQQQSGSGPYYGDKVTFSSSTNAVSALNVSWNFGNPESPDNTTVATTGNDVVHQYSGLTSVSQLTAPRTVTVTNSSDSSISDSVLQTLATPTVRAGIKQIPNLSLTTANAATTPLVTSDELTDASDGSVEGHYVSWTIDATSAKATPTATFPVGTCGAHTMSLIGNYGPYTGSGQSLTSTNGTLALPFGPVTYTVRPFVAIINTPSSDATNVTFTSGSRFTTDTAVIPANTTFTYHWDLLNAQGASLQSGSGTSFVVPHSIFTGLTGAKVRLQLSMAAGSLPAACQQYAASEMQTVSLNAPDPVISGPTPVATGIDCYTGGPCAMSVSGSDVASWTSTIWTLNPAAAGVPSGSGTTFSPSFASPYSGTVTVTATNAIGSTPASKSLNIAAAPCANGPAQGDVSILYNGGGNCGPGGNCNANTTISFQPYAGSKYTFNSTCDRYDWDFGDGSAHLTTGTVTHKYASNGTYSGSLKLTVGTSPTLTFGFTVVVGTVLVCPGSPGCPPPTCPTLTSESVFASFFGNTSNCSSNVATPCKTGEALSFTVFPYSGSGYNFACTTHTFTWSFGDNQQGTGQSLNHVYTSSGTFNVILNITTALGGSASLQIPVTVQPDQLQGNCTAAPSSSNMSIVLSNASANCNTSGNCNPNENITFTATPGYNLGCGTHTFSWDFGDGSATATGQTVQHSFSASASQRTVRLTAANNAGSGSVNRTIQLNGVNSCQVPTSNNLFLRYEAPSGCTSTGSAPCQKGETVSFSVLVNSFTGGGYQFSCGAHTYAWSFGDGGTSTAQNPTHVYTPSVTPVNYPVTCVVTNPSGSVTLTLPNPLSVVGASIPVVVDFTFEPSAGDLTLIKFTPSATPPNTISAWQWDFGDNTDKVSLNGTSTAPQYHQYAHAGSYNVSLTTVAGVVTKQVNVGTSPRTRPIRH